MRDRKPYYEPKEGEWVQQSLLPHTNYDACCGCGLVHRFDLKLIQTTTGKKRVDNLAATVYR